MRRIGFSTGALARGDFRRGLEILRGKRASAVELSALRDHELAPLVGSLDSLDLSSYKYVSFHAPSKFEARREKDVIGLLHKVAKRGWPIVLHPDTIHDFSGWRSFGDLLLIENMDKRYVSGRTARELVDVFEKLPSAGLCFDSGHCRQVDPTMNESYLILRDFAKKLKQLHVSEVNSQSTHDPLSSASIRSLQRISYLIPEDVPIILESTVQESEVQAEIMNAAAALTWMTNEGSDKGRSVGTRRQRISASFQVFN
jgi:hypothetical protein